MAHTFTDRNAAKVPIKGPTTPNRKTHAMLTATLITRKTAEYGTHAAIFPEPESGQPHKLKIEPSQTFTQASTVTVSPE